MADKFCLNKDGKDEDLAKPTCNGCLCGKENTPDLKREVGIVGGEYTDRMYIGWYDSFNVFCQNMTLDDDRGLGDS